MPTIDLRGFNVKVLGFFNVGYVFVNFSHPRFLPKYRLVVMYPMVSLATSRMQPLECGCQQKWKWGVCIGWSSEELARKGVPPNRRVNGAFVRRSSPPLAISLEAANCAVHGLRPSWSLPPPPSAVLQRGRKIIFATLNCWNHFVDGIKPHVVFSFCGQENSWVISRGFLQRVLRNLPISLTPNVPL